MKTRIHLIATYLLSVLLVITFIIAPVFAAKPVAAGPVQFPGSKIEQFAQPLPLLDAAGGTIQTIIDNGAEIAMRMVELRANMLPPSFKPANGLPYAGTAVFGYRVSSSHVAPLTNVDTYVNPVIVATRGTPTTIRYINNLTTNVINWRNWTDVSLHSAFHQAADMMMPSTGDTGHYQGPVLAVPHLRGGEVPALIDGGPEAWFASDAAGPDTATDYIVHGPAYYTKAGVAAAANEAIYSYPNTQEAAPLWFHDHLLGGTRLNATFAGLAGGYALTDPELVLPAGLLPVGMDTNGSGSMDAANEVVVPMVIQDRMFDTNGELFFPSIGINMEHPYWVPEFVGDTIVVNGKAWPYLNVDQQRYRFFAVNGSNSRPYNMFLQEQLTGVKYPMWVISTDGGYLDAPVLIDPNASGAQTIAGVQKSLMMMPGERYEIIIDFAGIPAGSKIIMRNTAPTVDGNPKASLDGRIMQFRVTATVPAGGDHSYNPVTLAALRPESPIVRLPGVPGGPQIDTTNVNVTRQLTLNEVLGAAGPLEALVNNSKWSGMRPDMSPIPGSTMVSGVNQDDFSFEMGNHLTEMPIEGTTEVWEILNLTMDSHPIHLHGLQFQLIDRQPFDMKAYMMTYAMAFPNGVYIPGYGPPMDYFTGNPRALGGNPDPVMLGVPLAPLSYEAGWKDTVIMHPGERTRIAVRIAPTDRELDDTNLYWDYQPNALNGTYVWHCHITDHEDNEMMRPEMFMPNSEAIRTYIQGVDY